VVMNCVGPVRRVLPHRHWRGPTGHRLAQSSRWCDLPREALLVLGGIVVYFGVRGLTASDPTAAVRHAQQIVSFERSWDFYVEPHLQDWVDDSHSVLTVMNWVYIWGHWPVITATLLWLFMRHYDGYRIVRNTMLFSGGIGLVIFATFPVAPPRLAQLGLLDTVTEYSRAYRILQPPAFVNQYAAMPSLHVGWDLLMGIAIFTYARVTLLRAVGILLPLLMATSVVLTANHYLIDGVAGAALVVACLLAVRFVGRPRAGWEDASLGVLPGPAEGGGGPAESGDGPEGTSGEPPLREAS
jgi:membrane-associated phospholipid phosphatase